MKEQNTKAEMLLDTIGQVPDEMVTDASPTGKKKNTTRLWRGLGVAAACLVVLGAVALGVLGGGLLDIIAPDGEIDRDNQGSMSPELAPVLPWDQYPIGERYYGFDFDGRSYSTQAVVAEENLIGQSLGEVTAVGYDWSNGDKKHTTKGTVHELRGVSTEFAVALRFETGETYVYADTSYRPETLGDLIDDLSLETLMTFGDVYTDGDEYVYHDVPDADIWRLMLYDRTLKNVYDQGDPSTNGYGRSLASASVYISALGYRNISLAVTDAGYLKTNIGSTGKAFFIGVEKAQQIAQDIADNYDGERYTYEGDGTTAVPEGGIVNPDGSVDVPESGEGQNTPSYNPR